MQDGRSVPSFIATTGVPGKEPSGENLQKKSSPKAAISFYTYALIILQLLFDCQLQFRLPLLQLHKFLLQEKHCLMLPYSFLW